MLFAPPESEYGDDSDSEAMNHLEPFRKDQRRDTLVSASGSSGSLCEAGQLERGFLKMLHDDDGSLSNCKATPKELELFWKLMGATTSVCKALEDQEDSSGAKSQSGSPVTLKTG